MNKNNSFNAISFIEAAEILATAHIEDARYYLAKDGYSVKVKGKWVKQDYPVSGDK